MKQKSCLFLAALLMVLFAALPALGAENTDVFTVGSFSYEIPSSWSTVDEEDGYYHYADESQIADDGYVYASVQTIPGMNASSESAARFLLSALVKGMIGNDEADTTLLSQFDIEIHGKYATILRMDLGMYGENYLGSFLLVQNGSKIFILTYLDKINTPDGQLNFFAGLVNSVEVND